MFERISFRALMMSAAIAIAAVSFNGPAHAASSIQDPVPAQDQHPAIRSSQIAATAASAEPVSSRTAGARSFVDDMAKRAVALLADKSLSAQQKKTQFGSLMFADVDLDTIGRFVLGTYWRTATPAQREEYLSLFREMIAGVWAERFQTYQGQTFEIRGARPADAQDDTLVSSFITPADNPAIPVDWLVRREDGQYKIVDVIANGVSLSVTQRSDFSSVIQRGGGDVEVLLAQLRQQVQ